MESRLAALISGLENKLDDKLNKLENKLEYKLNVVYNDLNNKIVEISNQFDPISYYHQDLYSQINGLNGLFYNLDNEIQTKLENKLDDKLNKLENRLENKLKEKLNKMKSEIKHEVVSGLGFARHASQSVSDSVEFMANFMLQEMLDRLFREGKMRQQAVLTKGKFVLTDFNKNGNTFEWPNATKALQKHYRLKILSDGKDAAAKGGNSTIEFDGYAKIRFQKDYFDSLSHTKDFTPPLENTPPTSPVDALLSTLSGSVSEEKQEKFNQICFVETTQKLFPPFIDEQTLLEDDILLKNLLQKLYQTERQASFIKHYYGGKAADDRIIFSAYLCSPTYYYPMKEEKLHDSLFYKTVGALLKQDSKLTFSYSSKDVKDVEDEKLVGSYSFRDAFPTLSKLYDQKRFRSVGFSNSTIRTTSEESFLTTKQIDEMIKCDLKLTNDELTKIKSNYTLKDPTKFTLYDKYFGRIKKKDAEEQKL